MLETYDDYEVSANQLYKFRYMIRLYLGGAKVRRVVGSKQGNGTCKYNK